VNIAANFKMTAMSGCGPQGSGTAAKYSNRSNRTNPSGIVTARLTSHPSRSNRNRRDSIGSGLSRRPTAASLPKMRVVSMLYPVGVRRPAHTEDEDGRGFKPPGPNWQGLDGVRLRVENEAAGQPEVSGLDEGIEVVNVLEAGGLPSALSALRQRASEQARFRRLVARRWGSLYFLVGLPAAVLAAVAGCKPALASTAGRIPAGITALTASALGATATFLDSRTRSEKNENLAAAWQGAR
jgi:hypothetical protein